MRAIVRAQSASLGLLRRLLFPRWSWPGQPRSILVYRSGRLGDFLNAIPALRVLRKQFPGARITLLTTCSTNRRMQELTSRYVSSLHDLPWLGLVTPTLVDQACVFSVLEGVAGLRRMREAVRAANPDCVFILGYSGESFRSRAKKLAFLRLAGARGPVYGWKTRSNRSILPQVQYRAGLFEHQVREALHSIAQCPAVPETPDDEVRFVLNLGAEPAAWADRLLEELGWSEEAIVAVAPGATFDHKRWPVERYARLCEQLHARWGVKFLVVGAQCEAALCDQLCQALGAQAVNLAARTALPQLADLFRRCALFVGNDGGAAHLASAAGCPCVTVTSALDFPMYWEPWNSRGRAVRQSLACEFCLSLTECPLGTNACILAIEVPQVREACEAALASRTAVEPGVPK